MVIVVFVLVLVPVILLVPLDIAVAVFSLLLRPSFSSGPGASCGSRSSYGF